MILSILKHSVYLLEQLIFNFNGCSVFFFFSFVRLYHSCIFTVQMKKRLIRSAPLSIMHFFKTTAFVIRLLFAYYLRLQITFGNNLDPESKSKLLDTLMVFMKELFEEKKISKKKIQQTIMAKMTGKIVRYAYS